MVPVTTTVTSTHTTTEPCLVSNGMLDVNVIPNENIINSNGVSIGDRVRLMDGVRGYSLASASDTISIKLTNDGSQIAIGQILINIQGTISATLFIKTKDDSNWKQAAPIIRNKTTFDNLYATDLQFRFPQASRFVKIGIIGCFPTFSKIDAKISTALIECYKSVLLNFF